MKRNEVVKKNADDMLFKIFQYLKASGISDKEFSIISAELAASCLVAIASFDEVITDEQIKKAKSEILGINSFIINDIMNNLEKYLTDSTRSITIRGK